MLTIGMVTKSQGIKGEVKAISYSDPKLFLLIDRVFVDGKEYAIEKCRLLKDSVFLKFVGINSCTESDLLKNKELAIEKQVADQFLKDDEFYVKDIIGCHITANGVDLGVVTDINNYGSADIYSFTNKTEKGMFPNVKGLIQSISTSKKMIEVDFYRFNEVVVYED